MSLTAHPDQIRASTPLRAAALQMSRGETYERRGFKPTRVWFDTPPATKPGLYSGHAWGRLKVIGRIVERQQRHSGSNATWLVRCACGVWESRRSRTIRTQAMADRCQFCEYDDGLTNKARKAVKAIRAANFFDHMRAEARALGISWQVERRGDRTYVAIAGRPHVWARELMDLKTIAQFRAYALGEANGIRE